jgi:hypothetical protein
MDNGFVYYPDQNPYQKTGSDISNLIGFFLYTHSASPNYGLVDFEIKICLSNKEMNKLMLIFFNQYIF